MVYHVTSSSSFYCSLAALSGDGWQPSSQKERGSTADDGLSTRKSSWWCLCYVISGNAADGGSFCLAFAVAPSLLLLAAALVRATRQAAAMPLPFLKSFAMPNALPHVSVAVPLEAPHNALPIGECRL